MHTFNLSLNSTQLFLVQYKSIYLGIEILPHCNLPESDKSRHMKSSKIHIQTASESIQKKEEKGHAPLTQAAN